MKKHQWSDISTSPLSEVAIRELYPSATAYRVSRNHYNAGEKFCGTLGVSTKIYALTGSCRYNQNEVDITVNGSEILELNRGEYAVEIIGNEPFNFVAVYELPKRK